MTQNAMARVALINLGCRLNRVETDLIAATLERAGCLIVDKHDADLVVVNTCAVTGEAQTKTRKVVRNATRLGRSPHVVATGCVANLFKEELLAISSRVVVEPHKDRVADRVLELLGIGVDEVAEHDVLALAPTPTGRMRPGIKIQDGCDNRCSFCIVWKARGPSRSLPSQKVVSAVREACRRNAREVVFSGINLGSYQTEDSDPLGPGIGLDGLLAHVLECTDVERIRLSSIEPPDVTEALLDVMEASRGRVAPFLHVCLQSGCDSTLARMGRVYNTQLFADVVKRARAHMPQIALGTDLIVGFPGETDDDFEASRAFCEQMGFARMHVFRYSRRPGTPAATMEHQVPPEVMAQRSAKMRALAKRMRLQHIRELVGKEERVLVQSMGHAVTSGLFDVSVDASLPVGQMSVVRFVGETDGWLVGKVPDL